MMIDEPFKLYSQSERINFLGNLRTKNSCHQKGSYLTGHLTSHEHLSLKVQNIEFDISVPPDEMFIENS